MKSLNGGVCGSSDELFQPVGWVLSGRLPLLFLILKVSGIPMLEKKMEENPDFAEYKRRVSVFFSLMIKKK